MGGCILPVPLVSSSIVRHLASSPKLFAFIFSTTKDTFITDCRETISFNFGNNSKNRASFPERRTTEQGHIPQGRREIRVVALRAASLGGVSHAPTRDTRDCPFTSYFWGILPKNVRRSRFIVARPLSSDFQISCLLRRGSAMAGGKTSAHADASLGFTDRVPSLTFAIFIVFYPLMSTT